MYIFDIYIKIDVIHPGVQPLVSRCQTKVKILESFMRKKEGRKERRKESKKAPNPASVFNSESENVEIKHFDTFWN